MPCKLEISLKAVWLVHASYAGKHISCRLRSVTTMAQLLVVTSTRGRAMSSQAKIDRASGCRQVPAFGELSENVSGSMQLTNQSLCAARGYAS